jgi:hypothetical protein
MNSNLLLEESFAGSASYMVPKALGLQFTSRFISDSANPAGVPFNAVGSTVAGNSRPNE